MEDGTDDRQVRVSCSGRSARSRCRSGASTRWRTRPLSWRLPTSSRGLACRCRTGARGRSEPDGWAGRLEARRLARRRRAARRRPQSCRRACARGLSRRDGLERCHARIRRDEGQGRGRASWRRLPRALPASSARPPHSPRAMTGRRSGCAGVRPSCLRRSSEAIADPARRDECRVPARRARRRRRLDLSGRSPAWYSSLTPDTRTDARAHRVRMPDSCCGPSTFFAFVLCLVSFAAPARRAGGRPRQLQGTRTSRT